MLRNEVVAHFGQKERYMLHSVEILTLSVSDMTGVVVLTQSSCGCACACFRHEFWHIGLVDDYLGQICRSR